MHIITIHSNTIGTMYSYRKIYIYIITVHVHTKVLDVGNPLATQKRLLAKY